MKFNTCKVVNYRRSRGQRHLYFSAMQFNNAFGIPSCDFEHSEPISDCFNKKCVRFKLVAKLKLKINIGTWFSVSELNMKDKKVAIVHV